MRWRCDPCSGVTALVTHPATHHLLFQTYDSAHCLQMLIICVFLSKTETTLHIYISLRGMVWFTCWYLSILAVAGVMMSVSNVAIRNICIRYSSRILTLNCSVFFVQDINPLNPELNPICYLLALLGAHHFLHVSRIKVKSLTLWRLMSYIYIYIYGAPILDVSRSHTTTQHSR